MAADPYKYFRLEAREILDRFGSAVLELEKGKSAEQVGVLLRLAHTLKGAARVVKQAEIADGAHAIEDALSPFREAAGNLPRDSIDAVLRQLDAIAGRVGALETPGQAEPAAPDRSEPAVPSRPVGDDAIRTVRAEIAEMDALLEGIAQTHALLGGLRATLRSVEQVQRLADLVAEQLMPRRVAGAAQHLAGAEKTYGLADDLRRSVGNIERQLGVAIDQIDSELRQSREAAEQMRLVGAGTLFTGLERTARDTARALAKEIAFDARGGDIRLDADVLATAQGALVQLVRNAVAHGIESPAERRIAGKPEAGRIALDISRRGSRIVFACRDDGRGIDIDGVRRAALRRGMTVAAVDRLDARELVHLLLRGGITTAAAISEVAGRGVGLDVVRVAVERLGGTIEVATEPGRGTGFELAVPLSLASIEALIVEAAGIVASIPLDAVRAATLLGPDAVSRGAAGASVLHEAQAIPFLFLAQALDERGRLPAGRKWPAVIIAASTGLAAIGVDRLHGAARTVVRPLPELAPTKSFIEGAALDAEGNPQLVLSPDGLVEAARRQTPAEPEPAAVRHPVLVVDDSLTTRMLEQSILESAGYEVDLAVSAEDALEIARRRRYALFLVDVEMPGMTGFEFVERVRADPALHDIPAVLVTSRAAPEDRRRGRDAGAQGYIVKGEFDQAELLTMIRPLVG
ncbi:MAG TPA: response regulator [Stellaceae bacterium]|nr:response regulator [Stellaceae bacterium]